MLWGYTTNMKVTNHLWLLNLNLLKFKILKILFLSHTKSYFMYIMLLMANTSVSAKEHF